MIAQTDVPQSQAAVVEAIDAERRRVREWAERSVREIEDERDAQLAKLDRAAAALADEATPPPAAEPESKPEPKPKAEKPKPKRRKPPKSTSPKDAAKRREAVYDLLVEKGGPIASGEIQRELGISQFQAKTAVRRLDDEGKIIRHGEGAATKYEAKVKPAADPPPTPPSSSPKLGQPETNGHGTLQGRMLTMVESAGTAGVALPTFVEQLHESQERIVKELGNLIREGEVKLTRKAGQSVYVPAQ